MKIGNFSKQAAQDSAGSASAPSSSSMMDPASIPKGRADEPEVTVKEKPPTPSSSLVDALEQGYERTVNELEDVVTPIKSYAERLKDAGIGLEHARHVLGTLLDDGGHYSEYVKLTEKTSVRFRTRGVADSTRVFRALELEGPRFLETTDDIKIRYLLAASLEEYGTKQFSFPDGDKQAKDAAFAVRLNFVENLSDFAMRVLMREFRKFDERIALILSDGAAEAF